MSHERQDVAEKILKPALYSSHMSKGSCVALLGAIVSAIRNLWACRNF